MNQFFEQYFNFIALAITILTSIIFVTFMLLQKRVVKGEDKKVHIGGLITITLYEVMQILLLIFVATNVILRFYAIFLSVSLAMLIYVEGLYLYKYLKYKNKNKEELEAEPAEA